MLVKMYLLSSGKIKQFEGQNIMYLQVWVIRNGNMLKNKNESGKFYLVSIQVLKNLHVCVMYFVHVFSSTRHNPGVGYI